MSRMLYQFDSVVSVLNEKTHLWETEIDFTTHNNTVDPYTRVRIDSKDEVVSVSGSISCTTRPPSISKPIITKIRRR